MDRLFVKQFYGRIWGDLMEEHGREGRNLDSKVLSGVWLYDGVSRRENIGCVKIIASIFLPGMRVKRFCLCSCHWRIGGSDVFPLWSLQDIA